MTITYCCYGAYADIGHSDDCVKRSGFFTLPKQDVCRDPGHYFPTHLHIPAGQGYRHVCPSCGKTTTVTAPDNRF